MSEEERLLVTLLLSYSLNTLLCSSKGLASPFLIASENSQISLQDMQVSHFFLTKGFSPEGYVQRPLGDPATDGVGSKHKAKDRDKKDRRVEKLSPEVAIGNGEK